MPPSAHVFGRSNPRIREIARLTRSPSRRRPRAAVVDALRSIGAALDAGHVRSLVWAPDVARVPYASRLVEEHPDVPVILVTPDAFRLISRRDPPSGLVAVVEERWQPLGAISPLPDGYWVAVSRSDYPGNLGCIIRSAVGNGASGVVLLDASGDPYHEDALRAAVGATFATVLVRCRGEQLGAWKERHRIPVIGVAPDGRADCRAYDFSRPFVLLIGSERQGILPDHRLLCDATVRIPMGGSIDSFNVCAAVSIVTYEAGRQAQRRPGT